MRAKVFKTGKIINVEYSTYSDYKPYIDVDNGDMYGDDEIRLIDDSIEKKKGPTQEEWYTFLEVVKEMRSIQRERGCFDSMKFPTVDEWDAFIIESYERQTDLEYKVDNLIKKFME